MTEIRQPGHNDNQKKISKEKEDGGHSSLQTRKLGPVDTEMLISPPIGEKFSVSIKGLSRLEIAL
jgi:hypothetical protein